jgi:hypothetical protein
VETECETGVSVQFLDGTDDPQCDDTFAEKVKREVLNDKSSKFLPPAQRKLTFIVKHRKFLAARDTAQKRDQSHPHPTTRFRTETLLVSNAQPAAGAPFEIAPDGTSGTTMDDFTFLHYLQRQGSLDLSRAKPCSDVLEAAGHVVDCKGDNVQNNVDSGQFTRRHQKGEVGRGQGFQKVAAGGSAAEVFSQEQQGRD